MKVKELIKLLQTVDPRLDVYVRGYEDGYDDAGFKPDVRWFERNVNEEWYYGSHEELTEIEASGRLASKGVVIDQYHMYAEENDTAK